MDQEQSVAYFTAQISQFIHPYEQVLLAFQNQTPGSLCDTLARALRRIGAVPVFWGEDLRWKVLLRKAFTKGVTAVFGGCSVLVALAKMAAATGTPLRIKNALICGDTSDAQLWESLGRWLDCRIWGSYSVGESGEAVACTCTARKGFHLWQERYSARILGADGTVLQAGEAGELELTDLTTGRIICTGERMRILTEPCPCGRQELRISRVHKASSLADQLQHHGAILDFSLKQADYGLELEVVAFLGKPLPKLPACAKRVVRTWNPDRDCPMGGDF